LTTMILASHVGTPHHERFVLICLEEASTTPSSIPTGIAEDCVTHQVPKSYFLTRSSSRTKTMSRIEDATLAATKLSKNKAAKHTGSRKSSHFAAPAVMG